MPVVDISLIVYVSFCASISHFINVPCPFCVMYNNNCYCCDLKLINWRFFKRKSVLASYMWARAPAAFRKHVTGHAHFRPTVPAMTDFWLISVPGNPEPRNSWEEIAEKTGHLSSNSKFNIPELKVLRRPVNNATQ